jgi:CRISPR-associated protein Csm2
MAQQMSGQYRGSGSGSFRGGGDRRAPQPAAVIAQVMFMPAAKLRDGQKIDPKLYSDVAEAAAKAVAGEQGDRNPKNKPSQLRRFYEELVALHDKVRGDQQQFEEQMPFIQMLKAKVAYAEGRDKVDQNFRSLLNQVVDQAVDPVTLKQARLFMEAFMAYYKVYRPGEG